MREIIENAKDFKIVPDKFRSSTKFDVSELNDDCFTIELNGIGEEELKDYIKGDEVEVFGLGLQGLVYFTTIIKEKDGFTLQLLYPSKHKDIQRREYSRVLFKGSVEFPQIDAQISVIDISAGGMKLVSDINFDTDKDYKIGITLENTPKIECDFLPIRTEKKDEKYIISGQFKNLESVDRVAIIQYTFKAIVESEEQNHHNV